ncbi:MAG: glycosyltransferase [Synechococcaceae cyanobacterium]|nr:glycosyltransferase [Synechococcaceae cyanobacterium]
MRILLITSKPPFPGRLTGGGQRTDLLMRALERCGDLELVLAGPEHLCSAEDLDTLGRRWRLLGFHPWRADLWAGPWRPLAARLRGPVGRMAAALAFQSGSYGLDGPLARWLDTITDLRRYDVVVARHLAPLLRSGLLASGVPVVLDVDDLDSEVLRQRIRCGVSSLSPLLGRWLVCRLRAIEARAFRACSHLWLSSREDERRLSLPHATLLPNVSWTPEGIPAAASVPGPGTGHVILFVGDLGYQPNSDGISAFLRQAWPAIRQAVPQVRLRLVGPPPPLNLSLAWSRVAGVELCGYLNDLAPAYAEAALTIAPILWGGGTCIKVLESLAHARPCVLTIRALQGHAGFLQHGDSVWCAADVAAMAEGCIRLLQDAPLGRAMGERGFDLVRRHASHSGFERIVRDTLVSIGNGPACSPL